MKPDILKAIHLPTPDITKAILFSMSNWHHINFSGLGGIASMYLPGPGKLIEDFPVVYPGILHSAGIWDELVYRSNTGFATLTSGDRLSFYLQLIAGSPNTYTAKVRINGVTEIEIPGLPISTNFYATVMFSQNRTS